MKYYAAPAVKCLADWLAAASERGETALDLCDMDTGDVQALFRRA
jgi:hypothetical protein